MSEAKKYGQVSLMRQDCRLVVDGRAHNVNLLGLPAYVRAVQFDFGKGAGWLEFVADGNGRTMPNQPITDGKFLEIFLQDWQAEEDKAQAHDRALTQARSEARDPAAGGLV